MTTNLRTASPAGHLTPALPDEVPFSLVDEAVQLLDDDQSPWSIQLEVQVAGRLDLDRLRAGLRSAIDAHPMARARRVASGRWTSHDRWVLHGRTADELRVLDCFDDDQLAAARVELQSLAPSLTTTSPLRAWLARHPGGDVLMLSIHHAAMDGFGALRVLRSIIRGYAGEPDPAPSVDFQVARELPGELARATVSTRIRRTLALTARLRDLVAPPARIARDGGTPRRGYGFQQRALTASDTEALQGFEHDGTVNDVLLAALHLTIAAWNAEHGAPCRRIAVLAPANLRPAGWRYDVAGNFALPARLSTDRYARRSRRAVLEAITAQTTRKKRTGIGTAFLELLGPTGRLPMWAKQRAVRLLPLTGDRLVDTSMFSNLGLLDEPLDFGGTTGPVTGIWFSPPARMPLGVSVGAVTAGGRLHLAFRHRHQQFGDEAARRFADRYMKELAHLSRQVDARQSRRAPGGYGIGTPPPVYPPYRSPLRRSVDALRCGARAA